MPQRAIMLSGAVAPGVVGCEVLIRRRSRVLGTSRVGRRPTAAMSGCSTGRRLISGPSWWATRSQAGLTPVRGDSTAPVGADGLDIGRPLNILRLRAAIHGPAPASRARHAIHTKELPIMTQVVAARTVDGTLRERARSVIPGGMYGHMNMGTMPEAYPQFMVRGSGCRMWDADGNEYIDFMCGWGPVILGRQHHAVEGVVRAQLGGGPLLEGPSPVMLDLAELLVDIVPHADWAMLAKNGTDATTACVTIARAATGRRKILVARGGYHGAIPWCTPSPSGVLAEDRAHLGYFDYNDVASLQAAVDAAGDDLAGIIVAPVRQELARDQELATAEFAGAIRQACDTAGAVMILDDVRCGWRLDLRGSWAPLGVQPDLAAWSKAIANGYALAAVTGRESLRSAATDIFVTGSFWYSAVSMAASIATLSQLRDTDALARIADSGAYLRAGL